jgi:hypothetical protein
MNKGIATETILLLLVGIIVVGILIFLVYKYVIGSPLGQAECRGMAINWCTSCKNFDPTWIGINAGPTPPTDLSSCSVYLGTVPTACNALATKLWCQAFIQT